VPVSGEGAQLPPVSTEDARPARLAQEDARRALLAAAKEKDRQFLRRAALLLGAAILLSLVLLALMARGAGM